MTIASFALATFVYVGLSLLFGLSWRGRSGGLLFVAAAAATALWAAATAWNAGTGWFPTEAEDALGICRIALWLLLGYAVLSLLRHGVPNVIALQDPLLLAIIAVVAISLLTVAARIADLLPDGIAADLRFASPLGLSVLGLVLIENLYQAARGGAMWAVKHLLIGLGALFAFDLFMYADALLLKRLSDVSQAAQPLVAVVIAPLLLVAAARLRDFNINVHVTRRVAVHTAALVSCGIYLLTAAVVAYLLRRFELPWGAALQVVFLVGALVLLAVLLSSSQAWAHGRHFIERNFFSFAYDYREEWLKLVRTMTEKDGGLSLFERAVRASAEVFECGAGALYLRHSEGAAFQPAGIWNWSKPPDLAAPPSALLDLVSAERPALELRRDQRIAADDDDERTIRDWLNRFKEPWILIALHVRSRLIGVILIGRPMLSRRLGWEDYDLLSVLASQIGSYLAVEQMARQLVEAQRFEQVSRHFSFVAHDLKNLITQLSIMVEQARRHAGNPEFVEDALATVGEAVEKMHAMLLRLRESSPGASRAELLEVSALVRQLVPQDDASGRTITFEKDGEDLVVEAERGELISVLQNVINNACEARNDPAARVDIAVRRRENAAIVAVSDNGPGMTPRFVEEELFSPFRSTKVDGFGIGMYQCRLRVERWGGSLEVDSTVGKGTIVRIVLPLKRAPAEEPKARLKVPA